ncbi:MAG TPA: SPFH domain-containing protein, partial [Myxococcaceae bacterium]|nr:SPFH domain-containing protein [Myxococcaceae bacterium]
EPYVIWRAALLGLAGCATVPVGNAATVFGPSGLESEAIHEGVSYVGPFAEWTLYDVRAQMRNEDLIAVSSDGAEVRATASLVAFHLNPAQLTALERQVGPDYYEALIRPTVQAAVRRVIARYPALDLKSNNVAQIEAEVTALVATGLQAYPIAIDRVDLRTVAPASEELTREIQSTAVWEQRVLAMPQQEALARGRGEALRTAAGAVRGQNLKVAPTLTAATLMERRDAAWGALIASPHTGVAVQGKPVSSFVEVEP